jgi:hypothetical protein
MAEDEKVILKTAYNFVLSILSAGEPTTDALYDLMELRQGNKELLLEHLKAINSITGNAINILGGKNESKHDGKDTKC